MKFSKIEVKDTNSEILQKPQAQCLILYVYTHVHASVCTHPHVYACIYPRVYPRLCALVAPAATPSFSLEALLRRCLSPTVRGSPVSTDGRELPSFRFVGTTFLKREPSLCGGGTSWHFLPLCPEALETASLTGQLGLLRHFVAGAPFSGRGVFAGRGGWAPLGLG